MLFLFEWILSIASDKCVYMSFFLIVTVGAASTQEGVKYSLNETVEESFWCFFGEVSWKVRGPPCSHQPLPWIKSTLKIARFRNPWWFRVSPIF